MLLVHVKLPKANVRDPHLIFPGGGQSSGEWTRRWPADFTVRGGGSTSTFSDINRPGYWSYACMATLDSAMIIKILGGSATMRRSLEEEEGVLPPPLLVLLDLLGGFVLGNGLLQLEMNCVYRS